MSKPLPRLARVRRTARLELAFTAKQMRWSRGRQRGLQPGKMIRQRAARIDIEGRAVFFGERAHRNPFAKEPPVPVTKRMHGPCIRLKDEMIKGKVAFKTTGWLWTGRKTQVLRRLPNAKNTRNLGALYASPTNQSSEPQSGGPQYYFHSVAPHVKEFLRKRGACPVRAANPLRHRRRSFHGGWARPKISKTGKIIEAESGMTGFRERNPLARRSDIGMGSKEDAILSELMWTRRFIPTVIF